MAAAADTKTAARVYSGSIEFLQGGQVLWARPCSCGQCSYLVMGPRRVYGRVMAAVEDPVTREVEHLSHARRESVGLESWDSLT
jgi:hypothetical protein